MDSLILPPIQRFTGSVRPPGSKSIANRALPLAAMAQGTTRLENLPDGEDVSLMRQALEKLGVSITSMPGGSGGTNDVIVKGLGGPPKTKPGEEIFLSLGNSGTATRILTALLPAGEGVFNVDGVARMRERPIGHLVDALFPLAGNTHIIYEGKNGFLPLRIEAKGLTGGHTRIRGDLSSQFTTGLTLALPLCHGASEFSVQGKLVSAPYVELTLKVMEAFGAKLEHDGLQRFWIANPRGYGSPGTFSIEPEASSATYFFAAAAIAGGPVTVLGLGKNSPQGEVGFAEVLRRMGAEVEYNPDGITVHGVGKLYGVDVDMDLMSDTGMTLAVTALFAKGSTTIRNIGNWRVKETDRLRAMATELRKVGSGGRRGTGQPEDPPSPRAAHGPNRHLRRSPHGHVLFADRPGRRGRGTARPRLRAQNLPRLFHGLPEDGGNMKRGLAWLFLGLLPSFTVAQKTWHTEPSPLLLRELQEYANQSRLGGEVGISIYSMRDRRFEAEWNDTDTFGLPSSNSPRKIALRLAKQSRLLDDGSWPESLTVLKKNTTDSVQGRYGYAIAPNPHHDQGDILPVVVWIKGFHGSPETASALMDSLFFRTVRWYNKERPAVLLADTLLSRPGIPSKYEERLRYFSRAFLGTPYSLGPTGEGRYGAIEAAPIVDLNRFDCVTYIESSVGLALSREAADLLPAVLSIRYHGDTVSYATRNHFFVGDWLGNDPQRFRILRLPGDTVAHKTLYKGRLLAAKGLPRPPSDPVADIPYMPYEKALQLAGNWTLGKRLLGVAFVTHIEGLDVTHTGFVDGASGKPVLRHASELKGKVVEQDFREYLESRRGKCAGVLFFEFLPPPSGE